MKKLMLSLFIAFGFSACSLNNGDGNYVDCGANTNVEFTGFPFACNYTVKTPPNNPSFTAVDSDEKLNLLFNKNTGGCAVPSDPNIDFTKQYLVGVFAGTKPTTGYDVKITSVIENNCQIIVSYYEKIPATGETVSQTPTNPADFILIPKTSKTLLFYKASENPDNMVIGSFKNQCTGADCQKFYQVNDYNIIKFLNVAAGQYNFNQYKYTPTAKRGDYSLLLKDVPAEILALKGQTKTYGTPDSANQGGIYFELRQSGVVTKVTIDTNDTDDQSAAIKTFKKVIQDKITSLK